MIKFVYLALIAMMGGLPQWQDPGEIRRIVIHPHDDTVVYVLASKAGILQTEESGDSWIHLRNGLPRPRAEEYQALELNPDRPGEIFLAESDTILKRLETGRNWTLWSELPENTELQTLAFRPDKSEEMLAGTEGDHCLLKSTDGGKTWLPHNGSFPGNASIHKIVMCPDKPQSIYAVVYRSYPDLSQKSYYQIFKSDNGGNSFVSIGRKFDRIDALTVILGKKQTLLMSADTDIGSDDGNGLFISSNGGKTWQRKQSGWYTSLVVSESDADFVIASGEKGRRKLRR